VPEANRVVVEDLGKGILRLTVRFGYADQPALPPVLAAHAGLLSIDPDNTSFFLGRETPVPTNRPDLAGETVRLHDAQRRQCVGLFPASAQARHRAAHSSRTLSTRLAGSSTGKTWPHPCLFSFG
jgi:hypothetical protein